MTPNKIKKKNNRIIFKLVQQNPKYKWYNLEPRYIEEEYTIQFNKKGELVLGNKI